ncbi:MAG: hypothetical protein QOE93_1832 [Actinomycetota bacterium]|jgi:putative FmdB family regulatory protein|nr:hypothetical protein [Actinomycetota bacterium]
MPKYEYLCKSCGERTEVKQSFEDDPLTVCPTCGGVLRKVFSSPGIVLRGPGFYRTDHRSPYRPDGTRPAEKEKDREPSEAKVGAEGKRSDSGSDSKGSDARGPDPRGSESKGSESKADAKPSESKGSGESGRGESGRGDSGRGESGRGDSGRGDSGSSGSSGDTGGSKDAARTA